MYGSKSEFPYYMFNLITPYGEDIHDPPPLDELQPRGFIGNLRENYELGSSVCLSATFGISHMIRHKYSVKHFKTVILQPNLY